MKEGWEWKKLGDVCNTFNGLWKGKKEPFVTVGVIRNTNFTKDCLLDTKDIAYLDVEKKKYENRKLEYGDLIIEKSGGGPKQAVGRVIPFELTTGEYSFSNFTSVLRIKNKIQLDFKYLHKFLLFFYITGQTVKMQSHTIGIRNIDFERFKKITVPIPPLFEQQRIVEIVDTAFAKIDTIKQNAERNLQNAKELFQSVLKIELTSKKEWVKTNIGNICSLEYGKPLNSADRDKDGLYPAYGANGIFVRTNKYYYDKPSIIIGRKGTAGAITLTEEKFYPLDVTYYVVFDKDKYVLKFLYYLFLTKDIPSLAKGVKPGINRNDVYSLPINYPSEFSEQQQIVSKLDALSAKCKKLENNYLQTINDCDELKKSILAKAFNGEL